MTDAGPPSPPKQQDGKPGTLRVSFDEPAAPDPPPASSSPAAYSVEAASGSPAAPADSYGNINTASEIAATSAEDKPRRSRIFLQGWFFLGTAGLLGALAGWGITEPWFLDGGRRWGNFWMIPLIVTLMCVGFAVAESLVERSARKALVRAGLSLPLGLVLGFIFNSVADLFYNIFLRVFLELGARSYHNPATWLARGIGWMIFGAAGGIVYGIIGQSPKKTGYGVLGGVLGAALGGFVFDPISFATHTGAGSRAVGFSLLGLSTGIAMGLVESALKDRWLYVTAGPLAGKQFILYKPRTSLGSSQSCDIYLFKDPAILPQHATLELRGAHIHFLSNGGSAYVMGQPVRGSRVLESGSVVQLGRYSFRYQEKQRG